MDAYNTREFYEKPVLFYFSDTHSVAYSSHTLSYFLITFVAGFKTVCLCLSRGHNGLSSLIAVLVCRLCKLWLTGVSVLGITSIVCRKLNIIAYLL